MNLFLIRFIVFHKYDRFNRAILFTGATFDANGDIDMRLGISFCDGVALTTGDAGATLNTGISYNVWHFSL